MLVIKTGSPLCFGVGSERARHGAAPFSSSWRRRPCALGAAAAPGGKEVSLGRSAVAADDLLCRRSAVALTAAAASWMLLPARTKAEEAAATIGKAYDSYAPSYNQLDGGAAADALGFTDLRQQLVAQASGRVLEVAVGTGLNLPCYNWSKVESLTAMDLSGGMLQQARATVATSPALSSRPITFEQCSVEALPFADGSFDCVLDTFSLCVFPRPLDALREMRRVVRPGGAVLLLEHSRSTSSPLLAAYQDLTAAPVAKLSKGCVWNQDVVGLAAAAGLRVVDSSSYTAGTLVMLRATKDAA